MPKIAKYICVILVMFSCFNVNLQAQDALNVARIKYDGGGDWYGNRTTFSNIFTFMRQNQIAITSETEETIELSSESLYKFPILYIAGHGNIKFSDVEAERLRNYLITGGFLWADDDYGMDKHFQREMKKVFPELDWVEVPFSHQIFRAKYRFANGLPKVHEHDGGAPKALALFFENRMIAFYSLNTDISDGCEDEDVHNTPADVRRSALQMASNILIYAVTQ